MGIYARRRLANGVVMSLAVVATAFGLLWLVLVLWTLLVRRHLGDNPGPVHPNDAAARAAAAGC